MTAKTSGPSARATAVLGGLILGATLGGCAKRPQDDCRPQDQYWSEALRTCVGLRQWMEANDGAFPDGYVAPEASIEMDASDASDAREASAPDVMDAGADATDAGADATDTAADATDAAPDVMDTGVCDGGQTRCASACVDTTSDPLNCGACAVTCPSTANGAAVCAAGRCDLRCDPGSHRCGNACLRDDDVASCGARCTSCAEPAGGRASCSMGMCSYACLAGFEDIGGACEVAVARPVFPPGTSTVTMLRPTLKWALPTGVDGAQIELCRDRACTMVIERINATGASARPTMDLPRSSVVFWRLRGRVGASTGTRVSATWQFRTPARSATTADTAYGTELDVNGDGFTDVAVGVRGANGGNGAVRFFYGSATGPSVTVSREIAGTLGAGAGFGTHFVPVGDVDGDGFCDVAFAAPAASPGGRMEAGQVLVYRGSAAGVMGSAVASLEGVASRDQFGFFTSPAGDVNGDGFADVVVGAPQVDMSGLSGLGQVTVLYGAASSPLATTSVLPGAYTAAGAIDVNGDQLSDLVVGHVEVAVEGRPFNGMAFVLHGQPLGISVTPQRVLVGPAAGERFGWVTSAGDVNGDGYSDVAIAAAFASPMAVSEAGIAGVYTGSAAGIGASAASTLTGALPFDHVGLFVSRAGDTNADGFGDLVVGLPTRSVAGQTSAGTAWILAGSASATLGPPQSIDGGVASGRLGSSVAHCGDVNADGFSDVIIASPTNSQFGVNNAGAAFVFVGRSSSVDPVPYRSYFGRDPNDRLGSAVGMPMTR